MCNIEFNFLGLNELIQANLISVVELISFFLVGLEGFFRSILKGIVRAF